MGSLRELGDSNISQDGVYRSLTDFKFLLLVSRRVGQNCSRLWEDRWKWKSSMVLDNNINEQCIAIPLLSAPLSMIHAWCKRIPQNWIPDKRYEPLFQSQSYDSWASIMGDFRPYLLLIAGSIDVTSVRTARVDRFSLVRYPLCSY